MMRNTDSRSLKKNIIRLSRKLNLEISEDISPLIDHLLKLGLLESHEIVQFKNLECDR